MEESKGSSSVIFSTFSQCRNVCANLGGGSKRQPATNRYTETTRWSETRLNRDGRHESLRERRERREKRKKEKNIGIEKQERKREKEGEKREKE